MTTADPSKGLPEFLQDLAAAQQTALEQQRSYNEALRSLFSRLASLCHDGYFTFADRPGRWINVNSITEVLEGAQQILDGPDINIHSGNGAGVDPGGSAHSNPYPLGDGYRNPQLHPNGIPHPTTQEGT